jgi:pSer/pThr/pTyr-binding forkhead associated (FHA) protein
MLAPELIVPEEFGGKDESKGRRERRREERRRAMASAPRSIAIPEAAAPGENPAPPPVSGMTRLLVFLDAAHPIKYPLFKDVMTIGRSESADIQIDGHFISRVHARIVRAADKVTVEDVGSKNGISVNSEAVTRHELKHGDVIGIGKLRFTFIEVSA